MSEDRGPETRGNAWKSDGDGSLQGYAEFIDLARIRVLVVPIGDGDSGPGPRTDRYVRELSAFSSIPLGDLPSPPKEDACTLPGLDVSPGMGLRTRCLVASHFQRRWHQFRLRQLHLCQLCYFTRAGDGAVRFPAHVNAGHGRETFLPWYLYLPSLPHFSPLQIVGVISCSEVSSLADAQRTFSEVASQYPTALVSRCFAFEATSSTAENTPGVIVIPNVEDHSADLSRALADICAEVLRRFQEVKTAIEARPVVPSPVPYPLPPSSSWNPLESSLLRNDKLTVPSSLGGTTANAARDEAQLGAVDRWINYTTMDPRTKKASPSRAQKLLGDLLLLAGRIDMALTIYTDAIDGMKSNSDFLWHAAATEGLACALLVRALRAAGIAGLNEFSSPSGQRSTGGEGNLRPSAENSQRESLQILNGVLEKLPKRYRDIVRLYERGQSSLLPDNMDKPANMRAMLDGTTGKVGRSASPTGIPGSEAKSSILDRVSSRFGGGSSNPVTKDMESTFSPLHPVLVVKAAIRIAKLLIALRTRRTMLNFEGSADWHIAGGGSFLPSYAEHRSENRTLPTRADVSAWLNKASSVLSQNALLVSVENRCWASMTIAELYAMIGMHRKWSFYLRMACLTIVDDLRKGSRGGSELSAVLASVSPETPKSSVGLATVQLLTKVADALHVFDDPNGRKPHQKNDEVNQADSFAALRRSQSQDDYLWLLGEVRSADNNYAAVRSFVGGRAWRFWRDYRTRVHFGWPDLQLNLIREAVDLGSIMDYPSFSYDFLCLLLRRFHLVLSPKEAIDAVRQLAAAYADIQDVDVVAKDNRDIPRLSVGMPVVLRMDLERPSPPQLIHRTRSLEAPETEEAADTFIHNPYDEKLSEKAGPADVVAGESLTVILTLANPLDIDLPLSKISIWTSGSAFEPTVSGCLLPARARNFKVPLVGVPIEAGMLAVNGIRVQTIAGVEDEVAPLGQKRPRVDDERQRLLGTEVVSTIVPVPASRQVSGTNQAMQETGGFQLNVLPSQPVLESTASAPGAPHVVSLFEGEHGTIVITAINTGPVAITSILVAFKEEYEPPAHRDGPKPPEEIYEREVYDRTTRGFWLSDHQHNRQLLVEPLAPGASISISVGCRARRRCIGTTVALEYSSTATHHRVLQVPIRVAVLPVLEPMSISSVPYSDSLGSGDTESFEEREKRRHDWFLLAFEIRNSSDEAFELEMFSDLGRYSKLIGAGTTARFYVPLARFLSGEDRAIPQPPGQFVYTRVIQYPPEEASRRSRLFWLRETLFGGLESKGLVGSKWKAGNRSGQLDLRRLWLAPTILDNLEVEDLRLDVDVVGASRLDLDNYACKPGNKIEVTWTISNTGAVVRPLFFTEFAETLDDGSEVPAGDALAFSGPLSCLLPRIETGASIRHSIDVYPLRPGRFHVKYHALGRIGDGGRKVYKAVSPVVLTVDDSEKAIVQ